MTRHAFVCHTNKIVIFWSHKVACSSIRKQFVYNILGYTEDELKKNNLNILEVVNKLGYRLTYAQAYRLLQNRDYKSIALIRDPYERLVSGFINKFVLYNKKQLTSFKSLEKFSRTTYLEIKDLKKWRKTFEYEGITFREFINYLCDRIDNRDSQEPRLNDHWNTQIPFFFHENNFRYDYLYNIEDSDLFFNKISEVIGKPVDNIRVNTTSYSQFSQDDYKSLIDTSSRICAEASENIHQNNFEDEELRRKVEKYYYIDLFYRKLCEKRKKAA